MLLMSPTARRLSALAGACLLSVALPALPVLAKEKTRTKPAAESTAVDVSYSVSIPQIDAVDSNVDDAVLTEILSGNVADNADALAGLTATSITVPELEVTVTGDQTGEESFTATITINDLVLEDVVDGVAGGVSLAGVDMVSDEGTFTFGTLSAAQFDIGGVLGIYGLVDASEQTELQTIYTDFTAEGGTLSADDVECTMGPVSGAEFKARPLNTSFVELMTMVERLEENPDDVAPADLGALMRMYADLFTAFETSEMTFGGVSCDGVDEDDQAISFSIAGMTMGGMSPGIYPGISMDGFDITVDGDGTMSLDNVTIKPTDLTNVIATLQSAPDTVDDAWFEENMRGLIPAFEGFSMSGFSMDIPDAESEGARIKADIGAFDLTLAHYLNGIPTRAEMSADNIQAEVPAGTGDESLDQLRALGVTDIDAGFRIAAAWDEAASAIRIEEISMTGADLATVTLAGTIANATRDLFSADNDAALAAAMGVAVQSLDLSIVDAGLADIALAAVAADQGGDVATLRPIYADLAKGTMISLLAGVADAAKLGDAVSAFVAGTAKTLEIGLEAKEEPGLGLMEFMAAETNPASILNKVNISATAK
ncbi:hypothetical protein [Devosia rhizoryzae]|uniref:Choice-of-anchor G family protein n=1 Tax=Devosia rhizoryzae TaxID=2774137 RepID=A0ABX7C7Y8_9HYPH|nr:hypothetical protein [Devosia rhizoryzae]QQR40385.1 hypothetical protein JI748_05105 [Devosia rhizoryzae]